MFHRVSRVSGSLQVTQFCNECPALSKYAALRHHLTIHYVMQSLVMPLCTWLSINDFYVDMFLCVFRCIQTCYVCNESFFRVAWRWSGLHNCLLATRCWVHSQLSHFYGKCSGFLPQSKTIQFKSTFIHVAPVTSAACFLGIYRNPEVDRQTSNSGKGKLLLLTGRNHVQDQADLVWPFWGWPAC